MTIDENMESMIGWMAKLVREGREQEQVLDAEVGETDG